MTNNYHTEGDDRAIRYHQHSITPKPSTPKREIEIPGDLLVLRRLAFKVVAEILEGEEVAPSLRLEAAVWVLDKLIECNKVNTSVGTKVDR